MSKVVDRWDKEQAESGHYSAFVGFEEEIRKLDNKLTDVYDELDIIEKIALFKFVTDMLDEEAGT